MIEVDRVSKRFRRHTGRKLIRERVGIALNDSKQNMVYNRLAKRLRHVGAASFSAYLALLEDTGHPEWQHFVNALTTNLSHFFREAYHFPMLVEHLRGLGRSPVRVWRAGGAERVPTVTDMRRWRDWRIGRRNPTRR